jgi:hypothetical protein
LGTYQGAEIQTKNFGTKPVLLFKGDIQSRILNNVKTEEYEENPVFFHSLLTFPGD